MHMSVVACDEEDEEDKAGWEEEGAAEDTTTNTKTKTNANTNTSTQTNAILSYNRFRYLPDPFP